MSVAYALAAAFEGSVGRSFWLDRRCEPMRWPALHANASTDLAVVGGGFSGVWTALRAKQRDPHRRVVLLEAERLGWAASGRNGGFCAASLTHGHDNGASRFAGEIDTLDHMGLANLDEIQATVEELGIDCGFERTGELSVATEAYQMAELTGKSEFLDQAAVRAELDSPTFLAGSWDRRHTALIDPVALLRGLADAAAELGVEIAEDTPALGVRRAGRGVAVELATGAALRADHVALATSAFRPLLRRLRWHTVPVYDYVLVTEPLTADQLAALGWRHRQGVADLGNQFHYYRLTPDNRILWGGYDAVYYYGRRVSSALDQRPATFALLAEQFFATFPQLAGIRFTHRWGGAIDTCTRFFAFYGIGLGGRVAYSLGHTGLGVGASRFSADVMLDLLDGAHTPRTELRMVRRQPLPFPPEPLAYLGIQATRHSLAAADRHQGERNAWLRALDRFGLGFDS